MTKTIAVIAVIVALVGLGAVLRIGTIGASSVGVRLFGYEAAISVEVSGPLRLRESTLATGVAPACTIAPDTIVVGSEPTGVEP